MQGIELASIFGDQMSGVEHASTTNQLIDAVIVFGIAGGLNIAAERTNLPVLKWLCWGASAIGAYIIYICLFT